MERRRGIAGACAGDLDAIAAVLDGKLAAGGGGKWDGRERDDCRRERGQGREQQPQPRRVQGNGPGTAAGDEGGGDGTAGGDSSRAVGDGEDEGSLKVDVDAAVGEDGGETLLAIAAGHGRSDAARGSLKTSTRLTFNLRSLLRASV